MSSVELIVDLERNFNIEFSGDELEKTSTVGEISDLVLAKALQNGGNHGGGCASAHVFYRLRRGLTDDDGDLHAAFRPLAKLGEIIPRANRRRWWGEWAQRANLNLPELVRPEWVDSICAFLAVGGFFLILSAAIAKTWTLVWSGLAAWGVTWLIVAITAPLAIHFPRHARTVGSLVRAVIGMNFHKLQCEGVGFHRGDVWQGVRSQVAEVAGVCEGEIAADTSFVRDLGLD